MGTLLNKANEILNEKTTKIIPENIRKGVEIFDVNGTYEGTIPWSQIGYVQPPQKLLEEFDYALSIANNWNPATTEFEMSFTDDEDLVYFPNLDLSNVNVRIRDIFTRCPNFEHFPALSLPRVPDMWDVFYECDKLTDESLNNIMLMCINATMCTKTSLEALGLSTAQIAKCKTLSNYGDFIASGWKAERNS